MEFIDRLILIMKKLNIKQNILANELNISSAALSKIIQKKSKPSLDTILALCKICESNNISIYWLMTGKEENKKETNITEEEQDLLNYFRRLPEKKQMRFLGRIEAEVDNIINAEVEENKQETKSSALKSG